MPPRYADIAGQLFRVPLAARPLLSISAFRAKFGLRVIWLSAGRLAAGGRRAAGSRLVDNWHSTPTAAAARTLLGAAAGGLVTHYDHSDHAITLPLYCDQCDWEIFGWSHSITLSVLEYLQGLVPSVIASVIV